MLGIMPIRNLRTITMPMQELRARLNTLLQEQPASEQPLAQQPLAAQVAVFERIERGKIDRNRATSTFVHEVEEAVDQILAVLYTPLDGGPMLVPRDAWTRSPLMRVLAHVTYWLYSEDLISNAEAARLLYGTSTDADLARLRRVIERGAVRHYWRPGREDSRGRAVLVRRSEVLRLKQTDQV
jgi:hypothetical protein